MLATCSTLLCSFQGFSRSRHRQGTSQASSDSHIRAEVAAKERQEGKRFDGTSPSSRQAESAPLLDSVINKF